MSPKNFKTCLFNIDQSKLSRLVAPGSEIGRITKKASSETGLHEGIPVLAGGSDKGCETLGVGCMDETVASLSFGTTATIQTTSKKYYEPIRFLPPYPAVIPGCYNPEIEIFRGYWLISWFKREFSKKELVEATQKKIAPEELLNKRLSEVPPGCHGLLLQPLWSPDILNPNAKGSVIGFGDVHTHSHLYRAIIEGINFSLIEGLEKIEKKSGIHVDSLAVSGGGSQSDEICQITSDMFNRPVKKPATYETSALGAAIIGFVGSGYYPTFEDAIKNMCHYSKIFSPRPEIAAIYKNLYHKVYVNIFPKLKPLYDEIQKITNYPEI